MERNRYLVMFQNYKLLTILLILPAGALMDILMFFYSFVGGFWRQEFQVYRYFLVFDNYKKILKARKFVQARRRVGDKEVIKRFVGVISFQDVQNPLLKYIANPIFNLYWRIIKIFIWW